MRSHRILAFVFVLFLGSKLCSQGRNGGYLSVLGGLTIPEGDYASTNVTNNSAGFALPGFDFAAQFAYKLGVAGGFSLMYNYQSNSVNNAAIVRAYSNAYPTYVWSVTSRDYENHLFMA